MIFIFSAMSAHWLNVVDAIFFPSEIVASTILRSLKIEQWIFLLSWKMELRKFPLKQGQTARAVLLIRHKITKAISVIKFLVKIDIRRLNDQDLLI